MTRLSRCFLFLLFFPILTHAAELAVRDTAARMEFRQKQLTVSLPLAQALTKFMTVSVSLQLVNPTERTISSSAVHITLKPGQRTIVAGLDDPFEKMPLSDLDEIHWFRIRYEIRSEAGETLASGIIPMSQANGLFRLALAAGQYARVGRLYQVEVNATNPVTQRPARGIVIQGQVSWDDEDREDSEATINVHAVTGPDGNARLDFKLPADINQEEGAIKVLGIRGVLVRAVEKEIKFYPARVILLDTDKPIYQPGQTLHFRALAFNSQHKAQQKAELDAVIRDEEETVLFRQSLTTDAFGVAHADWAIPSNLRLGNYAIQVKPHEQEDTDSQTAFQSVRIYRYDLPNFSVTAAPDHPYYLASQPNAFVKVAAGYLFGHPVTHAKVKVVEEEERRWNYRDQKWDIDEGQSQVGELDKNGEFTAKFDLSEHHKDLADRSYSLYDDVNLAAYVTDASTGRTEQRRFQIRVTKEPIHIYVQDRSFSKDLPADIFVSASYADGTPARCTVRVSAVDEDAPDKTRRFLRTIKTNKYGLAKIADFISAKEDEDRRSLLLEAEDGKGLKGTHIENLWSWDQETIRVQTPRTIYRTGDPLEVSLRSNLLAGTVLLHVLHDGEVIAAQHVTLHDGKAFTVFPYDPRFTGRVGVVAMSLAGMKGRYEYPYGSRIVLFPKKRRLALQVSYDKAAYRPGQEGTAQFAVKMPDGTGAASALGVKVVDQAVEERARTDQEFGSHYSRWSYLDWEGNFSFAGVTQEDLENLDLTQPVPDDMDLVAEYMMTAAAGQAVPEVEVDEEVENPAEAFSSFTRKQFAPLQTAGQKSALAGHIPRNNDELFAIGRAAGIDVPALTDPWGTPYRYEISYQYTNQVVTARSAGPDKRFGDSDDFAAHQLQWHYFAYVGNAINQVCEELFKNAGRFVRDRETLVSELKAKGIDFDALRDPWGNPYEVRFSVEQSRFEIRVISPGPNEKVAKKPQDKEIEVWYHGSDYFSAAREQLNTILNKHLQSGGAFPDSEAAFTAILRQGGVDLDQLRDPWGSQYYSVVSSTAEYSQRVVVTSESEGERRTSTPVTVVNRELRVFSAGMDKVRNTKDDFEIARYSAMVSQQTADESAARPATNSPGLTGNTGAIRGTVTDQSGAVITGATAIAVREGAEDELKAITDSAGRFVFLNLRPGTYTVRVSASGFRESRIASLPVRSVTLTEVSVVLRLGSVTETVEVAALAVATQTDSAEVSSTAVDGLAPVKGISAKLVAPIATPRLREYFPETMLWEPALVTDRRGRARLKFKLADNITTWKLSALASTKTGEMGIVEKDLRSFQPFFVEHDPPRVLTEGDEIAYPVVLRNYLDKVQTVQASMKPEAWFQMLSPAEQKVQVEAGDSGRGIFRYRTIASVEAGKQRITAGNVEINDAIEKPIDVHPFGRQDSQSDSTLFDGTTTLHVNVPKNAIPGSVRGELKIYPSLMAHVIESIEAVLERPYGCGEQTISSTYPSLLVVKYYRQRGGDPPPIAARAKRYLQAGYERLLRYQDANGGFTYWGHGEPDIALTAYALEFLTDASELIDVDSTVIENAGSWVQRAQEKDGSWHRAWQKTDAAIMETAHIVRVLGALPAEKDKNRDASLKKGLQFLAEHRSLMLEPYAIASYALAARASGDNSTADGLVQDLRSSAHREGDAVYWDLQTNTPFYCWGRPGRLESTALAMRAFGQSAQDKDLVHRGFQFLLRNQDRYGIWYSGHTTVNVLQTMMAALGDSAGSKTSNLQVVVNGKPVTTVALSGGDVAGALQRVDLTSYVTPGGNEVELQPDGASAMSAQAVITYYMPWTQPTPTKEPALRMRVEYSKTSAKENDTIECHVKAERVGFQGYGMMLAEIGLPPGVDVDRQSLEDAMSRGWAVNHYDVLPDRVVLYLWPQAGGAEFTFKFRLRFGMIAETAPSVIYDYYNPDAAVTLAPVKFEVQ